MVTHVENVEMTDEIRARLQGFAPISPINEFPYVPVVYRALDRKLWPVFRLKSAGGVDAILAQDEFRGEVELGSKGIRLNRGAFTLAVCRGRVLSWRNYRNFETGAEVPYDASLQCLGPELLKELANAILDPKENALSEEERLGLEF